MININPRTMAAVDEGLLTRLSAIVPATLGHLQTFGFIDSAIRPLSGGTPLRLLGRAVTVRSYGTDGAVVHAAIDVAEPGDVLVIDRGGDTRCACWGEMTSLAAKVKGLKGTIIDGAATDIAEILAMGYPVYARAISAFTSVAKAEQGDINVDISCGGVPVRPGDVILADENGIVVIPPGDLEAVLSVAEPRQQREVWLRQELAAGRALSELSGAAEKLRGAQKR
jgi:regulator of RNase E activity RraA